MQYFIPAKAHNPTNFNIKKIEFISFNCSKLQNKNYFLMKLKKYTFKSDLNSAMSK